VKEERTAEKKRGRKRKVLKKWRGTGLQPFYICAWVGLTQTRPTLSYSWPFDQDPDGSGSIQRSWSVSLIRIHQIRGFGLFTRRLLVSFQFLEFSCYVHPCVCYLDLLCVLTSLQNSKKNCYAFLVYLWQFCDILHVKIDKNLASANFSFDWDILCFFINFLACLFIQILVPWFWWLALDSMVIYPCSHNSSLNCVKFDAFVTFSMLLNLDFFWYFAILFNLILDTNFVIFCHFVKLDSWYQLCDILQFCYIWFLITILWYFHFLVKFDSRLLFCDISTFLLNLILDYHFVMFCNYV